MKWRDELRQIWEEFRLKSDAAPLAAFLAAHPEAKEHCGHEFPYLHRIIDIELPDGFYRLLRCAKCKEELTFMPIPKKLAAVASPGVSYGMRGDRLQKWVEEQLLEEGRQNDSDW